LRTLPGLKGCRALGIELPHPTGAVDDSALFDNQPGRLDGSLYASRPLEDESARNNQVTFNRAGDVSIDRMNFPLQAPFRGNDGLSLDLENTFEGAVGPGCLPQPAGFLPMRCRLRSGLSASDWAALSRFVA